jgi:hypothetical protein
VSNYVSCYQEVISDFDLTREGFEEFIIFFLVGWREWRGRVDRSNRPSILTTKSGYLIEFLGKFLLGEL